MVTKYTTNVLTCAATLYLGPPCILLFIPWT